MSLVNEAKNVRTYRFKFLGGELFVKPGKNTFFLFAHFDLPFFPKVDPGFMLLSFLLQSCCSLILHHVQDCESAELSTELQQQEGS